MGRIIADADLRAKLKNLQEKLEILDEHGSVIGVFSPVRQPKQAAFGEVEIPHTEEEIQELKKKVEALEKS